MDFWRNKTDGKPDVFLWDASDDSIVGYVPDTDGVREPYSFYLPEYIKGEPVRAVLLWLLDAHNRRLEEENVGRRDARMRRLASVLRNASKLVVKSPSCSRCADAGIPCLGRSDAKKKGSAACVGCSVLWFENHTCSTGAAATEARAREDESLNRHLITGRVLLSREADSVPGIDGARSAWQDEAVARGYSTASLESPARTVKKLANLLLSAPELSGILSRKRRKSSDSDDSTDDGDRRKRDKKRGRGSRSRR
jgi:hypothetical protein